MSYKDNFNVFVGGKSGVFKGIKIEKKANVIKNIQDLVSIRENDQITTISWSNEDEKDVLIACGVKEDKRIKVYDSESSEFTCSFPCNTGKGSINGLSRYNESILTAVKSGEVSSWPFNGKEEILVNAGENLDKMCHSRVQKNIIATGGLENRLKLFDLEKRTLIFSEKNLSHDWLELRIPIWISDLNFLPATQQIVTAGRYGHIRLYDPRAQRRPVINTTIQDEALTCLCITPAERHIIVGSGKGRMNLVDLRKSGTILNTYKGFAGGVTGVACSMSNPYVASVSLDRYLRIHHVDTKEVLKKIYLTSKLTCLVVRSDFSIESIIDDKQKVVELHCDNIDKRSCGNEVASEEEYDELFNKMEAVDSERVEFNKRRKRIKLTQEERSSIERDRSQDSTKTRNRKNRKEIKQERLNKERRLKRS
ncbi:WD repeat-containing protein 74 isoform X1 [Ooceraea biroi]|uniref:WD repeat-containing protein 74 isoform X1 n=1 Tax=Ooceraea biroi TaxID=2015173 RepID=UPI0005BC3FEC|nr:WD repeat-containing protein 74 isoform X1 [Ooceraea biroi]XP_011330232.1 WD repeat-containing protein 74 isoform X1 [Ooceraea biroi]